MRSTMAILHVKKPGVYVGLVLLFTAGLFALRSVHPAQIYGEPTNAYEELVDEAESVEEEGTTKKQFKYSYNHSLPQGKQDQRTTFTFKHFDANRIYQTEGDPGRSLTDQEEETLSSITQVASIYLKAQMKEGRFVGGRYRWLPDGVEYDISFKDSSKGVGNRVTLFQKLESPKVTSLVESQDDLVVNLILALQGRLSKYGHFLDHLVKVILPADPHVTLTVVYFSDKNMKKAEKMTRLAYSAVPSAKWTFIPVENEIFSRGRGLHLGAQSIRHSTLQGTSKLLFFCDVDVLMQPEFLGRCRSNTIVGHQVYYPVLFSQYNPHLIYRLQDKDIPSIRDQLNIEKQSGFWREFGFGMSCMYTSDYESVGGFPHLQTWGSEDVILYEKFLNLDTIKVVRSPDPGLFHLYHHKECKDIRSSSYVDCLYSKALTEGSQLQLGLTLLKVHEGIDLEGILSKRFYVFWLIPYLAGSLIISLAINILQAITLCKREFVLRVTSKHHREV